MTDYDLSPDGPLTGIPVDRAATRDLTPDQYTSLLNEVQKASNEEALRQVADEIVAATGYGTSHVLSVEAFAREMALSGLPRAAELAQQIQAHNAKGTPYESEETLSYHGVRENLYADEP